MKDENKKKRKIDTAKEQKKKIKKVKPEHQQEQEELFSKSDSISPVNKKIDKAEIVEFNNGEKINLDDYIREHYTEKATHFFQPFYFLIADLAGISRELMKPFIKPLIVPLLKHFLIYGRFPNAVQERLYSRNKYSGYYSRKQWNYQWLTNEADLKLRDFINQFEEEGKRVLAANGNIKTFIVEYCGKFGIPIQLEMFEQK